MPLLGNIHGIDVRLKKDETNMNSYYVLKDNNGYLKSFDFGGSDKAKSVMTKDINKAYRFDVNSTAYKDHLELFEGLQVTPVKLVGRPKNLKVIDLEDRAKDKFKAKKQVGGSHYQLPIQPVEYIYKNNLDFFQGNVVKYVTRYKQKNGLQDLQKAKHYIDLIIQQEYIDKK